MLIRKTNQLSTRTSVKSSRLKRNKRTRDCTFRHHLGAICAIFGLFWWVEALLWVSIAGTLKLKWIPTRPVSKASSSKRYHFNWSRRANRKPEKLDASAAFRQLRRREPRRQLNSRTKLTTLESLRLLEGMLDHLLSKLAAHRSSRISMLKSVENHSQLICSVGHNLNSNATMKPARKSFNIRRLNRHLSRRQMITIQRILAGIETKSRILNSVRFLEITVSGSKCSTNITVTQVLKL